MKYLILLTFLLIGCYDLPEIDVYVEHHEGKHQEDNSSSLLIEDLLSKKNPDGDTYTFRFTESCKYFIPRSDGNAYLGWNKILGSSGLNIHCRSLRLVWRYNPNIELFEIASYRYWECERDWKILAEGQVGEKITIHNFKLKHTFKTTAYFGGQYPAPHYMIYYIY